MITLFVIKIGQDKNIRKRTAESFVDQQGLLTEVVIVENHDQINSYEKKTPWFAVLNDGEYIDANLRNALPHYLKFRTFDFLCFYKYRQDHMDYSPRLFRNYVKVDEAFVPEDADSLTFEKLLDGWLCDDI